MEAAVGAMVAAATVVDVTVANCEYLDAMAVVEVEAIGRHLDALEQLDSVLSCLRCTMLTKTGDAKDGVEARGVSDVFAGSGMFKSGHAGRICRMLKAYVISP